MRTVWISSAAALRQRIAAKAQVDDTIPEAEMPAYMESFLAHLRLLIGVPFEYLVPDERLLPDESIRFFYVDRSWTDRLVDGTVAVGKMGTRELAHYQAHAPNVHSNLDLTERIVRILQRGLLGFDDAKKAAPTDPAGIVTGFLLRSAAVSGWPHMDVRAFSEALPWPISLDDAKKVQLTTLRLELLSPSVMIALFDGIPQTVWCEEPHHGVQFGVLLEGGNFVVPRRTPTGENEQQPVVTVPVRAANPRVIAVAELRKKLTNLGDPNLVPQTGSAGFAIEMLDLPWRQRFEGAGGSGEGGGGAFVSGVAIAQRIEDANLAVAVEKLVL